MRKIIEILNRCNQVGECWEYQGCKQNGYAWINWQGKSGCLAHRIVYEATYGNIPEGHFVCHHCDNRPCLRPDHLFSGTNDDNMKDMARKGRGSGPSSNQWLAEYWKGRKRTPENRKNSSVAAMKRWRDSKGRFEIA